MNEKYYVNTTVSTSAGEVIFVEIRLACNDVRDGRWLGGNPALNPEVIYSLCDIAEKIEYEPREFPHWPAPTSVPIPKPELARIGYDPRGRLSHRPREPP